MTWLRIDDAFPQHPKLVELARSDRWTWLEILAYCARYKTEGRVPSAIREAVPAASPKLLARFVDVGLLDEHEHGLEVHDWRDYNPKDPTAADRVKRYRHRNGGVTEPVTEALHDRNVERNAGVTVTAPRALAGARGPSRPLPVETAEQSSYVLQGDDAALPNESLEELGQRLEAATPATPNGRSPYGSVDSVYEVIDKPAGNTRRELEKWLPLLAPSQVEHVREQTLACEPRKSKAAYAVGTAQRLARAKGAA